ncbi:S8 family peptidase [Xanthomonas arboricola]|uniref:S8 family peptidase n=1 Tax=Xanthomonas arboricola TaxID=56448 RepID=UPI00137B88D0|nr:S8 family peptidase [Xanthomonas arboricola]
MRGDLASVSAALDDAKFSQESSGWDAGFGLIVRFSSFPNIELAAESFDRSSDGIELLCVQDEGGEEYAIAWIPEGKLAVFERKITDYLSFKKTATGESRDGQKLIDSIREIRAAVIEDLWTGSTLIPDENSECKFEVWIGSPHLRKRGKQSTETLKGRVDRFRAVATLIGISVAEKTLFFPERAVIQISGSISQLKGSLDLLGQIAELRLAPETADFFMHQNPQEQRHWTDELLSRATFRDYRLNPPYVCVLDTGCAYAHPLLRSLISDFDSHCLVPSWSTQDEAGHGTEQCGIIAWGDLTDSLSSRLPIDIPYRIESVKILPDNSSDYHEHYGYATSQAVALPEIRHPFRTRIFSLAITSTASTYLGKPTAWSSEIDAITSDWANDGSTPRLMILSGGNIQARTSTCYHSLNSSSGIEDPAQSWNALTVGAITHKTSITEEDAAHYSPIASPGGLSPFSTTSRPWDRELPFKPDVVFEGGNMGLDGDFASRFDSLSLLTTSHKPTASHFSTTEATSAACALASGFAAKLQAQYKNFRAETIRGIIVHSAEWNDSLLNQFPGASHEAVENRLRHCGWGEPNLEIALHSDSNSVTLIAESELTPFSRKAKKVVNGKTSGGGVTSHEMRLHKLPWPDALGALLDKDVELRVTLSYFIEPNPGERGRNNRFSYASHGLRFSLQKSAESLPSFLARINKAASQGEEEDPKIIGSQGWALGEKKRFRGSLHHDRLTCSAASLAGSKHLAVYPVGGWWKTRESHERFNRSAKYSLIVSVTSPELSVDIDLYSAMQLAIEAEIATIVAT